MKSFQTLSRLALFSVYFIIGSSYAQQSTDIRKVRWGFTQKQVKEVENTRPSSVKRDKLVYAQVPLADRTVGLEYEFSNDSLLAASYYYYTTASITKDDVISAAVDFESRLTEKYGPGKTSIGGDTRTVIWLTPRTLLSLSVGNVAKGWSLEIAYRCRVCGLDQTKAGSSGRGGFKPLKDVQDF